MRTFILALAAITLCACDPPAPKIPKQQSFNVCMVGGRHFENNALVTLKGEDEANAYDLSGSEGEYVLTPHAGTDDGMPRTHYAFKVISPFDPTKKDWGGENCQDVIGKILG